MSQRTPKIQTAPKTMSQTYHAKRKNNHQGSSLNGQQITKSEAQSQIMRRRDQLNMELMEVLEQETTAESIRENQLKQTTDELERRRLEKIFGIERAKASERIIATSDRHDNILR